MTSKAWKSGVSALALSLAATSAGQAEPQTSQSVNLYGLPGLIDMPSAEMLPDGELAFTHARGAGNRRSTLTFQIAPRLTGAFRYSGIVDFSDNFDVYFDRSFDLRYQVMDETQYRPAVAVGLRDFLGTGLFGGEYVVATKAIGDKLKVTGGLGWGRLGSYNSIFSTGTRPDTTTDTGGTLNVDHFFRGDAALFGGVSYQLNDKVRLLAEYSSDGYDEEVARDLIDRASPINLAVDYKLGKTGSIMAYMVHGNEVGVKASFSLNPKTPAVNGGVETAPLPVRPRPSRSADALGWSGDWILDGTDEPGIRKALSTAMASEGLVLESMSLTATRTEVRFRNGRYAARAQALGRLSRIMSRAFPPSVETFVLTEVVNGVPTHSTVIKRSALEALEFEPAGEMLAATQFADPLSLPQDKQIAVEGLYPKFRWSVSPYLATSIFDPDSPIRADVGLTGRLSYEVAPGIQLSGAINTRLTGNLSDEAADTEDSVLEPVRSLAPQYADAIALSHLTASWYAHPAVNVHSRVTIGYLERMYGGISGEVLWKKPENRYAFGAELNFVKQRDPDRALGFMDYDVLMGHVSGYYDFGNGYHGQLDVGRYLAGDWGATLSVDREFNNGWRVGAYATLTDVPFDEFGEGSFDKGIRITIPSDWFAGTPTTDRNVFLIQSLTRDGGARLNVDGRLYEQIRATQQPEIEDRWGRFWR